MPALRHCNRDSSPVLLIGTGTSASNEMRFPTKQTKDMIHFVAEAIRQRGTGGLSKDAIVEYIHEKYPERIEMCRNGEGSLTQRKNSAKNNVAFILSSSKAFEALDRGLWGLTGEPLVLPPRGTRRSDGNDARLFSGVKTERPRRRTSMAGGLVHERRPIQAGGLPGPGQAFERISQWDRPPLYTPPAGGCPTTKLECGGASLSPETEGLPVLELRQRAPDAHVRNPGADQVPVHIAAPQHAPNIHSIGNETCYQLYNTRAEGSENHHIDPQIVANPSVRDLPVTDLAKITHPNAYVDLFSTGGKAFFGTVAHNSRIAPGDASNWAVRPSFDSNVAIPLQHPGPAESSPSTHPYIPHTAHWQQHLEPQYQWDQPGGLTLDMSGASHSLQSLNSPDSAQSASTYAVYNPSPLAPWALFSSDLSASPSSSATPFMQPFGDDQQPSQFYYHHLA
ncbi:hypothetical protein FRB99_005254 [Tulasnella sp. 403]|nr:hypothetical protein FRB99_005254 [Tulasnella sp. 403]